MNLNMIHKKNNNKKKKKERNKKKQLSELHIINLVEQV